MNGLGKSYKIPFDYTHRQTQLLEMPEHLSALKEKALRHLQTLIQSKKFTAVQVSLIKRQITKIESLACLEIPQENGLTSHYYKIEEKAEGVTEKTCLVSEVQLVNKLQALTLAKDLDQVAQQELKIDAILKHPKAGKDTEVQREAFGLMIAKLLGFPHVTQNLVVSHRIGEANHPCLFVPFENMSLLTSAVNHPTSSKGRIDFSQHHLIEDLGKYSAYFMLCSDPDFIGKNGQNKGLMTSKAPQSKQLYIFDQVFMTDMNLGLDRSLNLIPVRWLSRLPKAISRHFMGRNKSVINDSSYEEKVKSIFHLLSQREAIKGLFKAAIFEFKQAQGQSLDSTRDILQALQSDSKQCLDCFHQRMRSLEKIMPKIILNNKGVKVRALTHEQQPIIAKAMLLNSLLNKPILFDKEGNPYRAPCIKEVRTKVKCVTFIGDQVKIDLGRRFWQPLSTTKQNTLKALGFEISADAHSVLIDSTKLMALHEGQFFDIGQKINAHTEYLSLHKVQQLFKAYHIKDGTQQKIVTLLKEKDTEKNEFLFYQSVLIQLEALGQQGQDLGFIRHLREQTLYGTVQAMQRHLSPKEQDVLEAGFNEAIIKGVQHDFVLQKIQRFIKLHREIPLQVEAKEVIKALQGQKQEEIPTSR